MKKIHELLKLPRSAGDVGIEIEVEGRNLNPIADDYWKTVDDASLRGHFPEGRSEYVLQRPIPVKSVEAVLDVLIDAQKNAKLDFSFRCSSHIHVNIQDLTYPQLLAYIYLCILLEEPLMSLCGEERQGNRFCLRINDAEGYIDYLSEMFFGGYKMLRVHREGEMRYAAINIAPITKYGSIEFRGMRGTLDKDVLVPWIQTLYRLREAAKKFGDPVAVYNEFVTTRNDVFMKKMLGKNAEKFDCNGNMDAVNRSFSLSIDLPNMYLRNEKQILVDCEGEQGKEEKLKHIQLGRLPAPIRWEDIRPVQVQPDWMEAEVARIQMQFAVAEEANQPNQPFRAAPRLRWVGRDEFGRFARVEAPHPVDPVEVNE